MTQDQSKTQDSILIKKIKEENCSESFVQLKDKYVKFSFAQARRFYNLESSSNPFRDNIDFILFKAVGRFEPERKTEFGYYLKTAIRFFFLNKRKIESNTDYIEDFTQDFIEQRFNAPFLYNESINIKEYINRRIEDKKTKKIFEIRYFKSKNNTWDKIGKKLKISGQTALNMHNRTMKLLQEGANGI